MDDLSREQLFQFLDYVADKGLMKKTTAASLRSACTAVLEVLEEDEGKDLSKLDIDSALRRYGNLNGYKVTPATLQTYGQRVRYAISEFREFVADRASWKPSGGQRTRTSPKASSKKNDSRKTRKREEVDPSEELQESIDAANITHRFPLRRDAVVTIKGIPFDVKKSEMARLNGFLANLVSVPEEPEPQQLMLGSPPNGQQEGA